MRSLAFVALLAACSDDGMLGPDAMTPDGATPDGQSCERPALEAPWLAQRLESAIAMLAAQPRFTTSQRNNARAYLSAELSLMGWTSSMHAFPNGANLVATIPATTGSGLEIIVGAHFDSVMNSPGANDNASGSAVVLALARYLKDMPCRTAPVTLVWFDLEEAGLFGSRAYAQTKDPAKARAVHTIDQVAWDADNDLRFELELPASELEEQWRAAAQRAGLSVVVTNTQGTDHQPFRERGFAAMGLTEEYVGGDTSPHRHLASDTASTIDMPYLTAAAKLTADVILTEVAP